MEQILSFALGSSAVLIILGAVLLVKVIKKVEKLESNAKDAIYWIQKNDELTNKRVDQEIDRINKLHRESISYTDSRVDKLEQKVLGNIEPKQVLKD
jgi:DNA replication protein DnaD